jgi:hypothetical protein
VIASHGRATPNAPVRADRAPAVEWLGVPHATTGIEIDGEPDDVAWSASVARTHAFVHDSADARPYSDARFTWANGNLYILLYAADEDLRGGDPRDPEHASADAFHLIFHAETGDRVIDVSPTELWAYGAPELAKRVRIARDSDGTLDMNGDEDEEWLIEMAVPLDALGLREAGDRLRVSIERCDTLRAPAGSRAAGRQCAGWGLERPTGIVLLQ